MHATEAPPPPPIFFFFFPFSVSVYFRRLFQRALFCCIVSGFDGRLARTHADHGSPRRRYSPLFVLFFPFLHVLFYFIFSVLFCENITSIIITGGHVRRHQKTRCGTKNPLRAQYCCAVDIVILQAGGTHHDGWIMRYDRMADRMGLPVLLLSFIPVYCSFIFHLVLLPVTA